MTADLGHTSLLHSLPRTVNDMLNKDDINQIAMVAGYITKLRGLGQTSPGWIDAACRELVSAVHWLSYYPSGCESHRDARDNLRQLRSDVVDRLNKAEGRRPASTGMARRG